MQIMSLVWGLLATVGMVVGFFPCFGALNWLNIPFAGVGAVVSVITLIGVKGRVLSAVGLACCVLALGVGAIRLIMGQGLL
jgi:hypothetical protein